MSADPPRLFVPGDGALPPALAGRSAEQVVLGRCLDDLARGAAPPHNVVLVGPARPIVAAWVADYYQSRYRELRGGGLMSAAVAVAPLFLRQNAASGQNATASEQELDAALAATGVEDAADRFAMLESLNRLGYVWCPPGQGGPIAWSAGIPSLMRYVLDQVGAGPAGGA